MREKKKSSASKLFIAVGVVAIFIGLDIVGLNPLSEKGSIVGRGSGAEGGCGGYEGDYAGNVSLTVPTIGSSEDSLFLKQSELWDSPRIEVCWENPSEDDEEEREWVREAVGETWEAESALEFWGWEACEEESQGIRIRIEDSGPRVRKLGKSVNGVKDGMILNFEFMNWSPTCQARREYCIRVVAVHEFGHAIGFVHEQNRVDSKCVGEEQGSYGDHLIGPWDLNSVMNYCNPRWSGGGQLSQVDIMGVQQVYGKSEEALRDLFDLCSEEETQGWQGTCEDPTSFSEDFRGNCQCEGNLVVDDVSGEIRCGAGTPNCGDKPIHAGNKAVNRMASAFRNLYRRCDNLRANSYWYGSCDNPALRDPALFAGECACAGDVYRHKTTGLFVCDRLPDTCGGSWVNLSTSAYEQVPSVVYTNAALANLYRHCNKLRVGMGDWLDCTIPAVDDPDLFNELCGCEEPLVRHRESGLYQCPRLQETCGGLEFEPDRDDYDLDNTECYVQRNGDDYRGVVSTTEENEDCIAWEEVLGASTIEAVIPELGEHNYCRTVRDKRKREPFCFTSADPAEWGYCDVGQRSSVCVEQDRYPCAPMPCAHGARCVDLGGGDHRCVCREGSQGDDCSTFADDWCEGVNCGANGSCETQIDGYTCNCDTGYRGRHCEVVVPPNKPGPFLPGDQEFVTRGCLGCSGVSGGFAPLLGGLLLFGRVRSRRRRP